MTFTPSQLRRARLGVFGCFATSGFVMGAWAAAYPSIERHLDLGEARLGIVLLLVELACLAAIGIGSAVLVPVMFSAIGNAGGIASNFAAMSMCGSAAFLTCPGVVGYLAEATSLTVGLVIPTTFAVVSAVAGPLAVTRLGRCTSPLAPVAASRGAGV